jgi:TRAP-type C4-dicarboxylate transport system permease small subunit
MSNLQFRLVKQAGFYVQKAVCGILVLLMLVMAILMFTQVVLRFCFGNPFTWAEELLRFMYIWLVFLGLPVAVYYNDLTRFDLLQMSLKGNAKKILETGIHIISNIMLYIIAWGAFRLLIRQINQRATTIPVSMSVIYMVIPVSAVIGFIFVVCKIILLWADTDFDAEGKVS